MRSSLWVSMLRPRALGDALKQATSPRIPAALLILPDGALIVSSTVDPAFPSATVAAIVADAWKSYTQRAPSYSQEDIVKNSAQGGDLEPKLVLVECEHGKVLVQRIGKLLLCLVGVDVGESKALFGDLRHKGDVLTKHLEGPLSKVQF